MPNRRFWNAGQDGEIMAAVEELEIKLYRLSGGRMAGSFKLSGCFGANIMDDDDGFGDACLAEEDPAEAARFARKLMQLFEAGRPNGGACC